MAQQLLQDRTPAAYAGVDGYARRHAKEDAGALAWLVVGYSHTLDRDFAKAIEPLNRAKAGASEVGNYVAYYLGDAYLKTAHNAEALATLADFSKRFPDSLLIRDAHLLYASALVTEQRRHEAALLLEKDRAPVRSRYRTGDRTRVLGGWGQTESERSIPQRLFQPACEFRGGGCRRGAYASSK